MKDLKNQLIRLGAEYPKTQPHIQKILSSLDDILDDRKKRFERTFREVESEIGALEKELERLDTEIEYASDQGGRHLSKLEKSREKTEKELKKSREILVNITAFYKDLSKKT